MIGTNCTPKYIPGHYHGKVTVADSLLKACSARIPGTGGFDWIEWSSQPFGCLLPTCSTNSITSFLFQNKRSLVVSVAMFSPAVYCWGYLMSLENHVLLTRMDGSDKKKFAVIFLCIQLRKTGPISLSACLYPSIPFCLLYFLLLFFIN